MSIAAIFLNEMGYDIDPISVESLGNGQQPMKVQMCKALKALRNINAAETEVDAFFEMKFEERRKKDGV